MAKKLANVTGTDPVLRLEGEPQEIKQALLKHPRWWNADKAAGLIRIEAVSRQE